MPVLMYYCSTVDAVLSACAVPTVLSAWEPLSVLSLEVSAAELSASAAEPPSAVVASAVEPVLTSEETLELVEEPEEVSSLEPPK